MNGGGKEMIEMLKRARYAAEAVMSEIERRNLASNDPNAIAQREPHLQRAAALIDDATVKIANLEASQISVQITSSILERLNLLAAELDNRIVANAVLNSSNDSLTNILDYASEVKKITWEQR